MTIGYFDANALVAVLSPGAAGEQGVVLWKAMDSICAHEVVELEVPSLIGRQLDRVAWVWTLTSMAITRFDDEIRTRAIDIAWLGAPPLVAVHVATADRVGVDHYVTADPVASSRASISGLDVVALDHRNLG